MGKWDRHAYKRPKYNNKPTEVDGIKFDSIKEAHRYSELKLLREAGEVAQFITQCPRFRLPGGVSYTADFLVFWTDGHTTIEDTKGVRTESYKAKKKIVEDIYAPITIKEL